MKKVLLLTVIAVLCFSVFGTVQANQPVGAEPAEDQTEGLIGRWDFNDGTDSLADDSSVNNNGGTLNNMSPANYVSDVPSFCDDTNENALSFNPGGQEDEQFIQVGNSADLRPTSITVSAWINAADSDTFGQIAGAGALTKGTIGYALLYSSEYNMLEFGHWNGYVSHEFTGEESAEGIWTHVSATYDETTGDTYLYVNGVEVDTSDSDPEPLIHEQEFFEDDPYDFQIGRAQLTNLTDAGYFEGLIDDVRVYDRALNDVELEELAGSDCVDDNDGISAGIEDSAPNGGDGNNDGTPDSEQANVASFVNGVTSQYVTLETDESCQITSIAMGTESVNSADVAYDYPVGLMNFTIDCGTPGFSSEITQHFYNLNNSSFVARKFNSNTSAYFTIEGAVVSQVEIGGLQVVKSVYTATDGGLLDSDGSSNGIIVDPAGLGQSLFGAPRTGAGGTSKN